MLKTILAVLGALVAIPVIIAGLAFAYLLIADTMDRNDQRKNNS